MHALDDQSDEFGDFIDWDDARKHLEDTDDANGISRDDIDHLLKDA